MYELEALMNTTSRMRSDVLPLHTHWFGKSLAPPSVHLTIGVYITMVGIVAVVGNSLVVLTCIRFKELRTRSNLLILNLAVGDLLMCVIDFPLLAMASFSNHWPFGKQVCHLYAFLTAVAGMVTINSLAAISADRYWAVVRRSSPGQQPSKCIMGVIVVGVWTYSVAWAVCPLFGWGNYVLDGIRTTCTFDYLTRSWNNRSFVISMSVSNFVLPFLVMIFSYAQIWSTIREIKSGLEKQSSLVSVGSCTYSSSSSSRIPKLSVGDERYSKLKMKSEDGLPINAMRKHLELDVYCDYSPEQSDLSLKSINGGGDVMVSTDPPSHSDRGTDFCRGQLKTLKPAKQWSHFQQLSDKMHPSSKERETHRSNDDVCFYKRHYKSSKYRRDRERTDTTKSTDQHMNKLYECRVSQKGDYPPISKLFIQNYYLTDDLNQSTDNAKTKTTIESHNSSHAPAGRMIFEKFRMKYRSAFRNGLFLKQHQYRLHCEQKTMKIIMFLLVAFIVSWCPYMIISLIGLFGDASRITYFTSVFPSLLAKTSMVFNPILYSISHPKVRKRILTLFCKRLDIRQFNGLRLNNVRSSFTLSNSRT